MKRSRRIIGISSFFLIILIIFDITCGSVMTPPWRFLLGTQTLLEHRIFLYLHVPRVVTALLAGMALSLSGSVMQTLFRNPIADPYILGVSSGACLAVAVFSIVCEWGMSFHNLPSWGIAFVAILGACLSLSVLMLFSVKVRSTTTLLLIGVLLGIFFSSATGLVQFFSNAETLKSYVVWSMGSLTNTTWHDIVVLAVFVVVGSFLLYSLSISLNAMLLGEEYAVTLGVSVTSLRHKIIMITALLTGAVTAFCGPISFIGMAIPHAARRLLRTNDHRLIIPMSAILGAGILVLCDALCALIDIGLPISILTSFFGVPFIVYVIFSSHIRQ